MDGTDRRADLRWVTAVRALDSLHRTTAWLRCASTAVLWASLAWTPPSARTHSALALLLATTGALLSLLHAHPEARARLEDFGERLPVVYRLFDHLDSTRGRATFNLPGLAEGFGMAVMGLALVGPFGPDGPGVPVTTVQLCAVMVFVTLVFVNIVCDAGYYAPSQHVKLGPDRSAGAADALLVLLRRLIPVGALLIAGTLFVPDWTASLTAVPRAARICAVLGVGAVAVVWWSFDRVLDAAVTTAVDIERGVRDAACRDLHSMSKTAVSMAVEAERSDHYERAEVRGLLREALVRIEEMRLDWLDPGRGPGGTVGTLWEAVLCVLPHKLRERCELDPASALLVLPSTDYQLARRVLSDLVANAVQAGALKVVVSVRLGGADDPRGGHVVRIRVTVADDGPGMRPDAPGQHSSLVVLNRDLDRYQGSVEFAARAGGGTRVVADWYSQRPADQWPAEKRRPAPAAAPPAQVPRQASVPAALREGE
ncbi:ATP-binding protein [Streptomyces sp. NBC_00083]|uniref:ATP-binding protein n=1 Tax=Streptomyces sp. NBC_00083 TaxID=2975647 RepID=UPI002254F211|nr:ATP-binding protein [Streptomyces sp. NBC_00083]MCX5388349.1 ATP-binding protein [Streptomyces sp. NBC_00083]